VAPHQQRLLILYPAAFVGVLHAQTLSDFIILKILNYVLRLIREAVMVKSKNIAKQEVLFNLAETLAAIDLKFKADKFKENFKNEDGIEAFRKDLQEVQYHAINRFPALVLRNPLKKGIIISGYRPFSVLINAVKQLIHIDEVQKINPEEYKSY
jgi:predicted DsbA family dithiol-disulfide isomerase